MRETLESDLADGDLTEDKHRETALDRIRALAYASPLGIGLKRLHGQQSGAHLHQAIAALDQALQRADPYARAQLAQDLTNLAKIAILEWLQQTCGRCEGRGWVVGPARIDCPKCGGSGKHRYTDGERARAFGRKLTESQDKLLEVAHQMIRDHDDLSGKVAKHMVERT